jgi:Tol biopolymer transport system component
MAATQVPGTEGAENPFWSPDGRNIGFFANGKLKKVDISGGSPQVICETEVDVRGGSWGPHDTILYPSTKDVIVSVRESGRPVAVTTLDRSRGEAGHRWPKFLPDGKHFLYTVRSTQEEQSGLYVGSLDGRTKKRLRRSVWSGVYAESGPGLTPFILFVDGSHLLAQRFDLRLLEFQGQPISVAQDLGASSTSYIPVSASDTGVLAYASPFKFTGRLSWYGRSGQQMGSAAPRGDYLDFRISPDDTKVAATLLDAKAMLPKLWLHESARPSAMQRFTFDSVFGASPVWSPDGTRIAFRTWRGTVIEFAENSASGGGRETQVLSEQALRTFGRPEGNAVPSDWSPDGKYLLYHAVAADTGLDLWLLPMVGERKPVRQLGTNFNEMQGAVSPDGRWLAYASDESGRYEIYVQTFPPSTSKVLVSTSGGTEPRWRGDSRELYYLDGARNLMAVPVEPANAFRGGSAQVLFHTNTPAVVGQFRRHYDVTKNGHRFLVNTLVQDPPPPPVITIVVNWASALNP